MKLSVICHKSPVRPRPNAFNVIHNLTFLNIQYKENMVTIVFGTECNLNQFIQSAILGLQWVITQIIKIKKTQDRNKLIYNPELWKESILLPKNTYEIYSQTPFFPFDLSMELFYLTHSLRLFKFSRKK